MASWQLQQADGHLGEVIKDACVNGPQIITQDGRESAVLLSIEDYRHLKPQEEAKPNVQPGRSAKDVLLGPPYLDENDDFFAIMDEIQAERKLDTGREIDL